MFVAAGARARLLDERRKRFTERYVEPLAGVVVASRVHAWPAIGRFFTTLSAAGLTGLLALITVGLLAGGYATMRRVTV